MNRLILVSLAALAIAGCKVKDTSQENAAATGEVALANASGAEVAKQVAAAGGGMELEPGQWETTAEVVSMDFPGMPKGPGAEQALAAMKGNPVTIRHCIKAEQVRKPDASLFSGKAGTGCSYRDFSMSGGKVSGTMTCTSEQGGSMTNIFAGSFQGDSMAVESEMTTDGPTGRMVMKVKQSGRRIGDCPT